MTTKLVKYTDNGTELQGYVAYPNKKTSNSPAVLVVHDWSGRNAFADKKAEALAKLGYIGFAVDMYGDGKTGNTKDEKVALMQPLMSDRALLRSRIQAAYEAVKDLEYVETSKIAVMGFCFGGLVALDLARSGSDIKATVSFHGLLSAPDNLKNEKIISKVLVLHGYADPMVPPEQVLQFANEMTEHQVDWQIDMYGNVLHAFTNPEANDPDFGTVYNKEADSRSWIAMCAFFKEVFGV